MTIKVKYSVDGIGVEDETYVRLDYDTLVKIVMPKVAKEVEGCGCSDIYIGEITLETEPIY